uniref:Sialate O-acetylesterase domain-containing protein n=1 Tax=Polytomella parva TaxID=51329 RepID=A0A7S0UUF5_9CHLO|mmetsp:Transcript_1824/g.2657  ORF Transcript_1824/g.2657 Transcript_1824/m.2657 type:complete len:459 (+) Transcript_1824:389-1765(+)|eukprot:CAMPEP_0175041044 /NCGR_PEP_ID=MMETSP0052_2-20121109/1667_1 /TAXON_ID=51329 ORGANISM="Polytomella parva, Strain SAG 63-3" /NCGR_SAMPLE_ID=MMETSP0052_2 /ASSEMBLY_ACC=CAM_ASM_000194 /LENGTH=458 /DNA_ID=CAMNT_0016303457 /DNA_START=338 /DNA_END=1714 /DNA_ORIENTATION=-
MGNRQSTYETGSGGTHNRGPQSRALPFCSEVNAGVFEAPHLDISTDVWIVAGDELAIGLNANDGQDIPMCFEYLPGLILKYNAERGAWIDTAPQVANSSDINPSVTPSRVNVGMEFSFARKLIDLHLSECVGIITLTAPRSTLALDWNEKAGKLNLMLLQIVNDAMKALPRGRLRGMIWLHGASFMYQPLEAYGTNAINDAKSIYSTSNLRIETNGSLQAAKEKTREGEENLIVASLGSNVREVISSLPQAETHENKDENTDPHNSEKQSEKQFQNLKLLQHSNKDCDLVSENSEQTSQYQSHLENFFNAIRYQLSSHHPMLPIILGVVPLSSSVVKSLVYPSSLSTVLKPQPKKESESSRISLLRQSQLNLSLPGVIHHDMNGFETFTEATATCKSSGNQVTHLTKNGQAAFGATAALAYFAYVRSLSKIGRASIGTEVSTMNLLSTSSINEENLNA